jgi:type IV pilus assembly protein PilE
MSTRNNAFSLIELAIVLAIIGILAAIALPSYKESIDRTRRTDCNHYLLEMASKQVQFYTQYSSYTGIIKAPISCIASSCGLNLSTDRSEYDVCAVTAVTTPNNCGPTTDTFIPCTGFTLMGTLDNDKKCATVSFDNLGQKRATAGPDTSLTGDVLVDFCWR